VEVQNGVFKKLLENKIMGERSQKHYIKQVGNTKIKRNKN
jgi:hypothetical protein